MVNAEDKYYQIFSLINVKKVQNVFKLLLKKVDQKANDVIIYLIQLSSGNQRAVSDQDLNSIALKAPSFIQMIRDIPFNATSSERYTEIRQLVRSKFGDNIQNLALEKKIVDIKEFVQLLDAAISFGQIEHQYNNTRYTIENTEAFKSQNQLSLD